MTHAELMDAIRRISAYDIGGESEDFEAVAPRMIEYAELRIYRDLDLLTQTTTGTATTTAGSRNVTAPSNMIVVKAVNLITPAGTTNPELGTRKPLERVSVDLLNAYWPVAATTGTPVKYALLSDTLVRIAPTPSAVFTAEFVGTARPTALSASNTTTFISNYLPDLFIAGCMVWLTGYQKNYGAQADDPKSAMSWEGQYATLKQGVDIEELRRKGLGG